MSTHVTIKAEQHRAPEASERTSDVPFVRPPHVVVFDQHRPEGLGLHHAPAIVAGHPRSATLLHGVVMSTHVTTKAGHHSI